MQFELTKEFLDDISTAVAERNSVFVVENISELHPVDIAEILDQVNLQEAQFIYRQLDEDQASSVLVELEEDIREQFLASLSAKEIATQLDNIESDDAADIIQDLPEYRKQRVLSQIEDEEHSDEISMLLEYDEDSAGGLMATEYIVTNINWTIEQSLLELRLQAEETSYVYTIYVVNDDNELLGTLSLKSFLYADNKTKIKNLYRKEPISVSVETDSEEVAQLMEKYDLVAMPVVDAENKLVGRITIDDIVDVIKEEAEKDFQMASGISERVDDKDTVWVLTRARLPWLLVGLFGGILGSLVIGSFDEQLKILPVLAFFIPLIGAMGGNVGVQSSAIIVQGIANNSLSLDSTTKKILKELGVALLNGTVLGILIFAYTIVTEAELKLSLTIATSLFSVIVFAGIFGTLIPLILHKRKIDPALATGPFITTLNDIIGQLIYFSIAWFFFF
ncbi:MAG: magnesium transporter [Flavobacteriales bacterium]|jgi:magnesium transporter|nr:magnesium transporter [Flavobacteriales bacterium]